MLLVREPHIAAHVQKLESEDRVQHVEQIGLEICLWTTQKLGELGIGGI
jgi:hypothetical protein